MNRSDAQSTGRRALGRAGRRTQLLADVPKVASFCLACLILVIALMPASTSARVENASASGSSDRLLRLLSHKRSVSELDAGAGTRTFFSAFADKSAGASDVEL